jgi:hypothetical protein
MSSRRRNRDDAVVDISQGNEDSMTPTAASSPALRAPTKRHVRSFAVLLATLVITMIGWSGAAGAQPQPRVKLQNLTVVDGDGNPFPGFAGVIYCAGTDPCQLAAADSHGNVTGFSVNPNVTYQMFGFASTDWNCGGWIPPFSPDEQWYFSPATTALGRTYVRPTTFVVARPNCTGLHILHAETKQPFALGPGVWVGVRACPVVGCIDGGPGSNVAYGVADANGDVAVPNLDPGVEYEFLAMARNIDGCSPGYVDPVNGDQYWFATGGAVTGTPGELEGTTFSISDNCGPASPAWRWSPDLGRGSIVSRWLVSPEIGVVTASSARVRTR